MMKRCLDEGTLQAYLDGELSQEQTAATAAHLAACAACAEALAEAGNESSFFAAAFAPDEAVNVPTEVLRSRINASVAQLESSSEMKQGRSRGPRFGGLLATLSGLFSFTPQGAAAFASVLAVVAVALIYFAAQRSRPTTNKPQDATDVARVNPTQGRPVKVKPTPDIEAPVPTPVVESKAPGFAVVNHKHHPSNRGGEARRAVDPLATKEQVLPGEKDYQTAIASLEKTIKLGGDASLRPSLRVEYEREVALLDSAISQTRQVAAQNSKDRDAVDFLMAAYQSKVELLTKVADQAQVATLGR